MNRTDVVIIGGSLAGATCARELTRLGVDVVAIERDTFPRPKVCGGFLSPGAVHCLDELGLLGAVRSAGAVKVDQVRIHTDGRQFEIPLRRPGLGISRSTLDALVARGAPVEQGSNVRSITRSGSEFVVETDRRQIRTGVVIDSAGKLSRFTARSQAGEFGIQFPDPEPRGPVMDFWFFDDGYGGAVSVDGGQSNFSFLIKKDALGRYLSKPGCLVTGPLAYDRIPGDVIAIGDAAGMVDPFCGEGMHHAFDSARIAARVVADGLRGKRSYPEMLQQYELESARRWAAKRLMLASLRGLVGRPQVVGIGLRLRPRWFLDRLWTTIPS